MLLWGSILEHSAWDLGVRALPQFWPEIDPQNTKLWDIIQMREGEQHFTTKSMQQTFLGSENTVWLHTLLLLWLPSHCAFTNIKNNSMSVRTQLLLYVRLFGYMFHSYIWIAFMQALWWSIYTLETCGLTIWHIIKIVQTDPELYSMIHTWNYQHLLCSNLPITSKVNATSISISNAMTSLMTQPSQFFSSLPTQCLFYDAPENVSCHQMPWQI